MVCLVLLVDISLYTHTFFITIAGLPPYPPSTPQDASGIDDGSFASH